MLQFQVLCDQDQDPPQARTGAAEHHRRQAPQASRRQRFLAYAVFTGGLPAGEILLKSSQSVGKIEMTTAQPKLDRLQSSQRIPGLFATPTQSAIIQKYAHRHRIRAHKRQQCHLLRRQGTPSKNGFGVRRRIRTINGRWRGHHTQEWQCPALRPIWHTLPHHNLKCQTRFMFQLSVSTTGANFL